MSSGIRRNFGTMTKPLHTGIAARSALTAHNLAACDFSAASDALEAKAGFFSTYGVEQSSADITANGLGKPFVIVDPGLALKKFPCCYASHRAIDGLLTLRAKLACDADSIEKVICRMPPGGMHVLTYPRPATGLEGKFSLHYPLAAAVLDASARCGPSPMKQYAARKSQRCTRKSMRPKIPRAVVTIRYSRAAVPAARDSSKLKSICGTGDPKPYGSTKRPAHRSVN
jgi:2-methylcitrate dehydratase PrpD